MKRALGLTSLLAVLMASGLSVVAAQSAPPAKKASAADSSSSVQTVTVDFANSIPPEDRQNLRPYKTALETRTKQQWLHALPAIAKPPASTPGLVKISAWVHTDGRVTGMTLEQPSGKAALDRAAWAAITGSSPYEAFPYGIAVDQVKMRFTFVYNGVPNTANGSPATEPGTKPNPANPNGKPGPPPILSDKHPQ